MTTITITFESDNPNLSITLDNITCPFSVDNNQAVFSRPIEFGFHTLQLTTDRPIKILDVLIDGVSVKHTLYLGYSGQTLTTEIESGVWELPFVNPVSQWISSCAKKIPNRFYGSNLYDKYEIFYPESIEVNSQYPKVLRDFFQHNFDFHTYIKGTNPLHAADVPYVKLNLEYNESALLAEFDSNLQLIEQHEYKPSQVIPGKPKPWQVAMAIYPESSTPTISKNDFPEFFRLLESIEGIDIGLAFIGALEPGGCVLPHIDDVYTYNESIKECSGCCQIYIPVGWKPGNYFKFHNVGLVPYDQGAMLINNTNFFHASFNDSDSTRYTIGILCKFKGTEFLKYVS